MAIKKSKIPEGPRAGVIYARYSSHAQNDASIEQQVAECMTYAREHGIEIVGTYADRAISGRTDKRPEFQRMMRQAASGRFAVVLAYKSNRISRNMMQALVYEDKLSRLGVEVAYCREEFGDNATGRYMLRSMMNLNQFFSENLSEDITRGMLDRARQCKTNGRAPYGYKKTDVGTLAIDEAQAEVVREIYKRVGDGETLYAVADDLNGRYIKGPSGGRWKDSSFSAILRNERYRGIYIYGDVRIDGGMPRIVDDADFYRVQSIFEDRHAVKGRRRGNGSYILTGRLYCGLCGAPMLGISGNSRGGQTYFYYACGNHHRHHNCAQRLIRREVAEKAIMDMMTNRVLMDSAVTGWMIDAAMDHQERVKSASPVARMRAELAEVDAARGNILRAVEAGLFTPAINDRLQQLHERKTVLEAQIKAEESSFTHLTRDDLQAFLAAYAAGSVDDPTFKKRILRSFVARAYLYENTITVGATFAQDQYSAEVVRVFRDRFGEWDPDDDPGGPGGGLPRTRADSAFNAPAPEYVFASPGADKMRACLYNAGVGVPNHLETNTASTSEAVFVFCAHLPGRRWRLFC